MKPNEGSVDRVFRVIVAVGLFTFAFTYLTGILQIVAYVASVALLVTAVTGFCFLYTLLGINTCPVKKK